MKGVICSLKQYESSEKCEQYQQISIQDLLSGKMYLEHSAATKEEIFRPSSNRSAKSANKTLMYLSLIGGGGNLLGASWEMVSALPGEPMMLNIGEFPNVERESTLSQILDLNAPEKYCLSPKACSGILRRAEKRNKTLPSMLKDALMEVVGSDGCHST